MWSDATSVPGRMLRAGLLLPLLVGMLAMHVLMLCSDGAGAAGHASVTHGMPAPAAHLLGADPVSVGAAAPGPTAEPSSTAALVCVAVLGAVLVLVLRRRDGLAPCPTPTTVEWAVGRSPGARPPPPLPLRFLLCVSRT